MPKALVLPRLTWLRVLVAVLLAVAALSFADIASAQSISIVNEQSLPRLDKDGRIIQKRPLNLSPEAVNLQDCYDDQLIRFTLQMSGFQANASVQVWASNAGADCKQQTVRTGLTPQCWKVLDTDIPLQTVVDVDIPVRHIMAGAPPNQPHDPKRDEESLCGKVDLATITVHFLYFAPGQQATAAFEKTVAITVDTVGPKPPSGLRALPGNGRIQVSWVNISGGTGDAAATGGLTELTGVKVYCDVAGSAPSTPTAPTPECHEEEREVGVDDAGNPITEIVEVCEDAGTTTPDQPASGCSSANFRNADGSPIYPSAEFNQKFECGSMTGNTGTTVVASSLGGNPLQNGTTYAVAVAATDKFGNVGQLSDVICETPEETTDFWQDYRNAGGSAGGGCSAAGASPLGSITVLLLAIATAGSTLRRRNTSKSRRIASEREDRR